MSNEIATKLVDKVFRTYDEDGDGRLNKFQFTKALNALTKAIRGEMCPRDDLESLFHLIDVNGDSTITKK